MSAFKNILQRLHLESLLNEVGNRGRVSFQVSGLLSRTFPFKRGDRLENFTPPPWAPVDEGVCGTVSLVWGQDRGNHKNSLTLPSRNVTIKLTRRTEA